MPGYFTADSTAPASRALAVTTSDSATIENTRAVYVGGGGDLKVLMYNSTSPVTFSAVPAGTLLPIQVKQVLATGTTATLILALY